MITLERIDDIVVHGGIVVTSDGAKIGSVEQVFLSEASGNPAFVTVRTGLFGMSESFVPLAGAKIDGSRILVAFDRTQIRNGPRIESDRGSITVDEESELYRYYGVPEEELSAEASEAGDPEEFGPAQAVVVEVKDAAPPAAGPPTPPHPDHQPPPHPGSHPHPIHGDGPPPHLLKHVVDGHRSPPPNHHRHPPTP
ncbi:PRC-barrel domain containing protein [Cryobacterium algoritolerans]|uniref:PRC-barrel domain containing protein n=1 Tax=Cryobacterium algoritolerans TaxID=1259184 RepID=A0A4R8WRX3_9MICO|nr:PRC-barrel domain-containing protein [Cryobacterium algoritolerans]TFC13223.1 PRC-barrel domain containing protein [Cryobacterium algoritolerans]